MADFCLQCSVDVWGEDMRDMADITVKEHTTEGIYACVLCEGCGPTMVDHTGKCILPNCLLRHGQ